MFCYRLSTYTDSDDSQVEPLLKNINQNIASVSADTAYDTDRTYGAINKTAGNNNIVIAIPPRKDFV